MSKNYTLIVQLLSIIIALILTIIPLPDWAQAYRPDWVLLVVIFWCLNSVTPSSLVTAWSAGLAVDLLTDSLLGQHALMITIICYLVTRAHRQLDSYALRKQSLIIGLYSALYLFINYWILGIRHINPGNWTIGDPY